MMIRFFLLLVIGAVLTGCDREHPAPPSERNELVLRFFENLEKGNTDAAIRQGRKIVALDPANDFIIHLLEIQESNAAISAAQKKLDAGDVDGAVDIITSGIRKYPENRTLPQIRSKLRQLKHARKLITSMETVKNPESMSASLTAARTGLSANISPALRRYFDEYAKKIEAAAKADPGKTAKTAGK